MKPNNEATKYSHLVAPALRDDSLEQIHIALSLLLDAQRFDIVKPYCPPSFFVAAFYVNRTFKEYRISKGEKKSPMPDFYIGEHAKHLNIPLVTRDVARLKTYQPKLQLTTPNRHSHQQRK